jgi:N-acetylneuraminate synthase
MVQLIAEIGINHNGDINIAKQLIHMAYTNGFDMVKFQKRAPSISVPQSMRTKMRDTPWGYLTYLDYKEKLELGRSEYDQIDEYCRDLGIDWFASAWDISSFNFLKKYKLKYHKIASSMLTYKPLLEAVAKEGKVTFISTGMSSMSEIDNAVEIFKTHECPFVLMHSVSIYPCNDYQCNIRMVKTLHKRYDCLVGYSGHEPDILPSILAVFMGAVAIERHITLDRAMWGTDQAASLENRGQILLVRDIRKQEEILGSGNKIIYDEEIEKAGELRYWDV